MDRIIKQFAELFVEPLVGAVERGVRRKPHADIVAESQAEDSMKSKSVEEIIEDVINPMRVVKHRPAEKCNAAFDCFCLRGQIPGRHRRVTDEGQQKVPRNVVVV